MTSDYPAFARLRIGGTSIFTLRSTGRLRLVSGQLSDMRRTVAAQVKIMPGSFEAPLHILRWLRRLRPDLGDRVVRSADDGSGSFAAHGCA
jgi:hypothetical protein